MFDAVVQVAKTLIWDHLLIYVLLGARAYFTIRIRFLHYRFLCLTLIRPLNEGFRGANR
jgi:Na+/alanine symporter